jgi:hypothetical protein
MLLTRGATADGTADPKNWPRVVVVLVGVVWERFKLSATLLPSSIATLALVDKDGTVTPTLSTALNRRPPQ